MLTTRRAAALATITLVAAAAASGIGRAVPDARAQTAATATTPINHVIVLMMENHTYDNLFGTFPGTNGATLPHAPDPMPYDINHYGDAQVAAIDGGRMDEFQSRGRVQYQQSDIPNYWSYAQHFGMSDNFYTSVESLSSPNHLAMIAAQSGGLYGLGWTTQQCGSTTLNDLAVQKTAAGAESWAPACYAINTVPQLLSAAGLSWKYYYSQSIWDAPAYVQGLGSSPNVDNRPADVISDIQGGALSNVSWVIPPQGSTDHPPGSIRAGQNWVTSVVNAVMGSSYWKDTAIFLSWDDWGGFYDHVPPPSGGGYGPGLCTGLVAISPYARRGYVSHNQGEFASFDKFIEANWGLHNLGQRDAVSGISNLRDLFDFTQAPQPPLTLATLPVDNTLSVPSGGSTLPGAQATLDPVVGCGSTTYTYGIIYQPGVAPVVHNVTVDGVAHAMSVAGPVSGGVLYDYATSLPSGEHTYSFTFSDASNSTTVTYPLNGTLYSGPSVHPFCLGNGKVPANGLLGKAVTFSITYTSPANVAPVVAEVDLDGTPHAMHAVNPTGGTLNYATGVHFAYTTSQLALGDHYYRFRFDDGSGQATLENGGAAISTMRLAKSAVSPASGTPATLYTFSTTLTDVTGAAPLQSSVYIDGSPYAMHYVSGQYSTGALFQYTTTLPVGSHSFYFVFRDAQTSWSDPFGAKAYNGPSTALTAATAVASPALTTSPLQTHDQNPDIPLPALDALDGDG